MKTDARLRNDLPAELNRDPAIRSTDTGVIVKEGVITLTGHLASRAEKHAAQRAAPGLATVVNKLLVAP